MATDYKGLFRVVQGRKGKPPPSPTPTELLIQWRDAASVEDHVRAIEPFRRLFALIGTGAEPDWHKAGVLRSSFFGWGLQHAPERKTDKMLPNPLLNKRLEEMTAAGESLKQGTAKYAAHNARMANPKCPKCRGRFPQELFEEHKSHCRPWNQSTLEEQKAIERENELIRNPPPAFQQPSLPTFNNAQEQYATCVTELGHVQARLLQAPPHREIVILTARAKRLLELIEAAATGF